MKRLVAAFIVALAACRVGPTGAESVEVTRGDLIIDVDVTGTLESVASLRVGPPSLPDFWNFKIAMMAEEGAAVEQGAPVLMFDTSELTRLQEGKQAERDSAAAQLLLKQSASKVARADEKLALAEARAELRKAELKADVPPELLSTIERSQFEQDVDLARAKVAFLTTKAESASRRDGAEIDRWKRKRDRDEARVKVIGGAIDRMTVTAQRAGTIVHATDWRGDKKKVGDSSWPSEAVVQVVSLDQMEGKGEIDEVDVSRVAVGQAVSLRLDAQSDIEMRGTVKKISTTVQRATPENPLKVAVLQIELAPGEQLKLRPGMRFRGRIETERERDVLLVPLDALAHTTEGPVAHVVRDGQTRVVPVTLGRRNARLAVVESGLSEGDELRPFTEANEP